MSKLSDEVDIPNGGANEENAMKRVLVVVQGGVADYVSDDGIDVHVFDFDNYQDDPVGTEKVPEEFADLAAPFGAPVEGDDDEA